jgi:SAM-dependent methyltransferase
MLSSPSPAEASRGAVAAVGAVAASLAGPAASRALPRFPENEYDYGYLHDFMKLGYVPRDCRAAVLGCGKGEEAVYFSERGYRVTGIDNDRNSIGLARERAWLNGRDIDFMIGNVFESASLLPAESFGLATDRGVFRRVQGERERRRYLELVRRILLPGGVLLLSATLVDPSRRAKKGRRRRRGQDDLLVEDGGEVMGEVLRAGLPIVGRRLYPLPAGANGDEGRAELLLYCRKQ